MNSGANCGCICREVKSFVCQSAIHWTRRTEAPFHAPSRCLLGLPKGQQMFDLAHQLLVEMGDGTGIEAYQHLGTNPDKFVHGYGIFQYDLQFFRSEPDFFLMQKWQDIAACVEKLMVELRGALEDLDLSNETSLTDLQSAFVAIIYNTGFGNFNASRGLKQGHNDGAHFYGENIDRFMKIAATIPTPSVGAPPMMAMAPATAANPSIVTVARAEFDRYHGINEGSQPLRGRIADYYEAGGGSRNLDPTLDENAWSAAFVSFCVKQSGATADQFTFNLESFGLCACGNRKRRCRSWSVSRSPDNCICPATRRHHSSQSHGRHTQLRVCARSHWLSIAWRHRGGLRNHGRCTPCDHDRWRWGELTGRYRHCRAKILPFGCRRPAGSIVDRTEKLICVIENQLARGAPTQPVPMPLGPYVVSVRTDLKLRGGPGAEFAAIIKALTNGTRLNVLAFNDTSSGRWALVDLQGDGARDGFVFAQFLEPASA